MCSSDLDGVRMDLQVGGAPWEALPLAQVERIEIVRGPAAVVYGSDAIAGVVQIFTRRASKPGFAPYAGVGAGSRGMWKADAGFTGQSGTVDYALGVSHDQGKGYSVRTGGNPDRDGWRNTNASASAGYQLSDQHRLQASALWGRMKAQQSFSMARIIFSYKFTKHCIITKIHFRGSVPREK